MIIESALYTLLLPTRNGELYSVETFGIAKKNSFFFLFSKEGCCLDCIDVFHICLRNVVRKVLSMSSISVSCDGARSKHRLRIRM